MVNHKQSTKAFSSDQLETEEKKIPYGSRKLSNPSFIASQSKFEEPSSNSNWSRPSGLLDHDVSVSSTLGSPDRSETLEIEHDAKDLVEGSDQLETVNDCRGNIVDSVMSENFKVHDVEPEKNASDLLRTN